jgi:hypothetical protein
MGGIQVSEGSWQKFEADIRELARLRWGVEPQPRLIAGVKFDCVLEISWDRLVVVEITKNNNLDKIRGDINRLGIARLSAFTNENIYVEAFIVISGIVTEAMFETGTKVKVKVADKGAFQRFFFDHKLYASSRRALQFGSAVDPITGKPDSASYVPVLYSRTRDGRRMDVAEIGRLLSAGHTVVLTGEYGAGKSRCVKEAFDVLSASEETPLLLSIDLRRSWGLTSGVEILRRHLDEIGMAASADNLVRALNAGRITILLDGFDEIGAQSWSKDATDLRAVRHATLKGVRDIVSKSKNGILICGREHYFNSTEEMLSALGVKPADLELLRVEDQFTEEEMEIFLQNISLDVVLPDWLPRRPLMCQAVASLDDNTRSKMFNESDADVVFWRSFMDIVCEREAKIKDILKKETIFDILQRLGRVTRAKIENLGPLSPSEIQKSFQGALGHSPSEESAVMLQRLPGLGRVGSDTEERKFIDIFILDGLRALDVAMIVRSDERAVTQDVWFNGLEELGQRILAAEMRTPEKFTPFRAFARDSSREKNRVLAGDIVASAVRSAEAVDFKGLEVSETVIGQLDLEHCSVSNLRVSHSLIQELIVPAIPPVGVEFEKCQIGKVFGITDRGAIPNWLKPSEVEEMESAANVSRIKSMNLEPQLRVMVTILKKVFLQKGSARQEDALLRGLGQIDRHGAAEEILRILKREGLIKVAPGDHGNLYIPERRHMDRIRKIVGELGTSKDPIWLEVAALKRK